MAAASAPHPLKVGISLGLPVPAAAPASPPSSAGWYVRPTGGGQFGPATEQVFCAWIAEGRVTADALVWREGWAEWKPARDAADELPMPLAATPVASAPRPVIGPPVSDSPSLDTTVAEPVASGTIRTASKAQAASQYLLERRRTKKTQLTLAVVLLAAVIILAVVLFWVLRHNTGPISQAVETLHIHGSAERPSLCVIHLGNLPCESAIS